MPKGNYFAQYESPNIVLVPSLSSSNDERSTSNSGQTFAPCNLPCCNISAAPATVEYTPTPHITDQNNFNYFDTVHNNYNVFANTTEKSDLKVTWLPRFSQFGAIEDIASNSLVYTQQPTYQDYSWPHTYPYRMTDNLIDNAMYAVTTAHTIKINLKEKQINDNEVIQETIDDVNVNSQKNEDNPSNTNETSNEENKGTNLKTSEGCDINNVTTNANLPENVCNRTTKINTRLDKNNKTSTKRKTVNKDETKNNAKTKTKTSITTKEKCKVTKPKKDLKYLWKRHCAKLKDKIKEEIEGSKDMKTQLHTQWKSILKAEYNTFVKKFYSSAWINKNKIKSVIVNNKLKLNKKSNSDLKCKQPIPNSSSKAMYAGVDKDNNRIKSTSSLQSITRAPKRAYFRKQYEEVDLRSILSRKRNQNLCYEPRKPMAAKRPRERENLIITVNQDIQSDSQEPITMEPKPKKKCKKIKLVINVVCNDSESEEDSDNTDNDQCTMFNEDLSFLDDFNVDDIVDSLNCDNISNVCKDESTDEGLNGLCLSKPEKINTAELCSKEKDNVNCSSSAMINGNANNDITETSVYTHNSSEEQNITATTIATLNVKMERNDLDQRCDTANNTELYTNDVLILREINNIKNEFIAKIEEKHNMMGAIVTESAHESITNNTQQCEMIIKSENANMENNRGNTNSSAYYATMPNTIDINTEVKLESNKENTTPVQIADETNGETQDLVEIKTEDEPIITLDDDSSDESITNIKGMEIEEGLNSNLENEKINLPEDNTLEIEAHKKENALNSSEENAQNLNEALVTLHEIGDGKGNVKAHKKENALNSSEENAQNLNKELVTLDEIGEGKGNAKIQDDKIQRQVVVKATKVIASKNIEVTEEAVKSIADDKKMCVSHKKNDVSIVSNNIPNFKEVPKNKQLRNKFTDQEIVDKLEERMFDFLDERYTIMSVINCGRFSRVFKCTNSKGQNFALKVLNYVGDRRMTGLPQEKMLMRLQKYIPREQLNIVYMLNSFGMMGKWCFIMEYYPKNLEQALLESKKGFHINLVQVLARQLVAAVTVLTNNNIVHTDIKPKHVLLNSTNDKLKLCGFDESNYIQNLQPKPNTGTVNYRAPEIILGFIADYRIDVWSTALVLFEMATGKQLFPGIYNNDILYKQMCTLGEISNDMLDGSAYKHYHFSGGMFKRIMDSYQRKQMLPYINKNNRLYSMLFTSYRHDWQSFATKQEVFEDKAKLNQLHQVLQQMLALDPRFRLPINFVGVSEFLQNDFS